MMGSTPRRGGGVSVGWLAWGPAVAVLLVGACMAPGGEGWRSELFPEDWQPGHRTERGHFLHDFSYAGYGKGERCLPDRVPGATVDVTLPPYEADPSGEADSTAAIQQALDEVGAEGGGVVYLPAGTYRIAPSGDSEEALRIADDGVVLRGDGAGRTFLFNDEPVMRRKSVIRVSPRGTDNHWRGAWAGSEIYLASDAPNQASTLALESVADLDVGQWVVARSDVTEAFVREAAGDWLVEHWAGELPGLMFYRRITAIDRDESTITLDIPLRYPLQQRDNARVYRVNEHLSEVGIEHLSIGMREHPASEGWGDVDYHERGTGAYEVHAAYLITLNHLVNGWVRNVHTYRPEVNQGPYHMVSNGIRLLNARNVTVSHCDLRQAQYRGGGGNGYGYIFEGSDNLIRHSSGRELRYVYDFKRMRSTGNVVHRSEAWSRSDFHMHLSVANLLDNLHMRDDFFYAGSRRTYGPLAHGRSTDQSVFWNTRGSGSGPEHVIEITDQADGVFIVGTRGPRTAVRGREEAHEHRIEGLGQGQTLQPVSLYEAQLNRRLGEREER